MISFCQDLTISYEYHVYDNKNIKKIVKKRNGSNISEKIINKTSKIQVISKNHHRSTKLSKPSIKLLDTQKKSEPLMLRPTRHQRSKSNYLNENFDINANKQEFGSKILNTKKQQIVPLRVVESELGYIQRKIATFLPNQFMKEHYNNNGLNFFNQLKQTKINQNENLKKINQQNQKSQQCLANSIGNKLINFHYSSTNEQGEQKQKQQGSINTIRQINPIVTIRNKYNPRIHLNKQIKSYQKQNQFIYSENSGPCLQKNRTFSNFVYNTVSKEPQLKKSHMNSSDSASTKYQMINFSDATFSPPTKLSKSIFQDAVSIQSRQIKLSSSNEQQNQIENDSFISVVQQRNYFFQKQQKADKIFKKSIDKFIVLGSEQNFDGKWTIYNRVEDKDTKRIYSMKSFTPYHSQMYVNEYQVYLGLRNKQQQNDYYNFSNNFNAQQNNHSQKPQSYNNYVLEFYNVILSTFSLNKNKKYNLIKETYDCIFIQYLVCLKKTYLKGNKSLLMVITRLQTQIKQIFIYLSSKGFQLIEMLSFQDFVICRQNNFEKLKFHSLYKLEEINCYNLRYQNKSDKESKRILNRLSFEKVQMFCKNVQQILSKQ